MIPLTYLPFAFQFNHIYCAHLGRLASRPPKLRRPCTKGALQSYLVLLRCFYFRARPPPPTFSQDTFASFLLLAEPTILTLLYPSLANFFTYGDFPIPYSLAPAWPNFFHFWETFHDLPKTFFRTIVNLTFPLSPESFLIRGIAGR